MDQIDSTLPFSFTLRIGSEALNVSGTVPCGPCAITDLVPLLLGLGEAIVSVAERNIPDTATISCGPGCGACCRQLVPISLTEAAWLRHKVLPELEPAHRGRVEDRIRKAIVELSRCGLDTALRDLPNSTAPPRIVNPLVCVTSSQPFRAHFWKTKVAPSTPNVRFPAVSTSLPPRSPIVPTQSPAGSALSSSP